MRNIITILLLALCVNALAQNSQATKVENNIISINKLQTVANNFAAQRWGNVDVATPIPYYDPQDNIIGYGFNFAIDKDFTLDRNTNIKSKPGNETNINRENEYAHIVMGNNLNRIAIVRFINSLSDEYTYSEKIDEMASEALESAEIELEKVYYQTPMLKYYKYSSHNNSVYVRIFPPAKVLSEAEFQEEYVRNFNLNEVMPKSSPEKWKVYFGETNTFKSIQSATYIPHPECVPFLDWHYGCSPTAGAMLLGYWDNYSEYSADNYSNLSKYHYYDYDPVQNEHDFNVSSAQERCSIEMNTNAVGETYNSDIGPGLIAAANSINCGSYNFTENTTFYNFGSISNKWNQQVAEINLSRPWHCGVDGHSMTAIGYEIDVDSFMIVHNTWDNGNDWWNYALNYRICKIFPGGSYGKHIKLTSFLGDTLYNHKGKGEVFLTGNSYDITWDYELYAGSYCNLLYSNDDGLTWNYIASNTANDGSYAWTIPAFSSCEDGRLRIECYDNTGNLIGSDGSWGSFLFINSASITTLISDNQVSVSSSTAYYSINHPYSTWGVVGITGNDTWDIKMYDSNTFTNGVSFNNSGIHTRYIAFNQHNLSNNPKGVQVKRKNGQENARIEFEGYTETLTVGLTENHVWPENDVVEIWDVYLNP